MAMRMKIDGTVARLLVSRPPVNALDLDALEELNDLIAGIERDRDIKALIFESGIEGLFCAGGDMKFWPREFPDKPDLVSSSGRYVFDRIERLPQPTIALINGKVIGDGLSLALACDLRVATRETSFHVPEVSYGFIPGWGTVGRMKREIGKAGSTELLLIGEPVDAETGLRMGLVHRVCETGNIDPITHTLALALAKKPPIAMRQAKAVLQCGNGESNDGERELDCFKTVWGGAEWNTGVAATFKTDLRRERNTP